MKKNIGKQDQTIRFVLGLILLLSNALNWVSGNVGISLLLLGVFFLITASFNFCPLYKIFNFSSLKKNSK